jgi:hypothetical protein
VQTLIDADAGAAGAREAQIAIEEVAVGRRAGADVANVGIARVERSTSR